MSKGLEIINIKLKDKDNKFDRQVVNGLGEKLFLIKGTELDTIEKELKALEIIKKKEIDVYLLSFCKNANDYNSMFEHRFGSYERRSLSQEEFDLLKEVLND